MRLVPSGAGIRDSITGRVGYCGMSVPAKVPSLPMVQVAAAIRVGPDSLFLFDMRQHHSGIADQAMQVHAIGFQALSGQRLWPQQRRVRRVRQAYRIQQYIDQCAKYWTEGVKDRRCDSCYMLWHWWLKMTRGLGRGQGARRCY